YAKAENISVFTVFFSLFNVLLAKLTGDDDIIVGVPVVGRTNSNLENIVGMFVNTLVLRNNPTGNIVLKNFLIDVNNKNTESFEKQNYPFEKLVEKIEKDREINRNPIFDIMFSMQNMVSPKLSLENLTFNPYPISSKSTQFDFSLDVIQNGNEFNLVFEYSTELFTNRSIKRYISYYNTLLNDFNFNLNKKIKNINILSEIEKELLLVKFNDTIINYPKDKTIIDMFEEQVEKTPNNIAVVFKENELTYRELNNEANKVGHFLRDNYYIESCDFVGLMLERSEKLIIGLLGILKTGAAYVPIDPQYPKKRIDYILNDSNVKIVISEIDDSIFIDINRIIFGDVKKSRLENKANNESDFYAIYTSGTTGNPKGTVISHYNYINYILWAKEFYFEDKECGNFGLFTSISFDLTTTSIFLSLLYGKTLKVFNQNTRISEILHEIFTDDLINCVKLTPSHISILPSLDIKKSNIKLAIVGGEELINDQVKILKSINKHMKIVNEYGPTETTVGCIAKQIDDIDEKILIGKPIANTKIYLMKDNNLTPVGVPGEIYISGKGVAEGYLNRTGFSEKKFLDNPFVSGERMYKSGDLGRWLPDGNIEYLGRIDNQIKIRGFRIELGEIEKSLLLYDYIDSTVVIVKEGIGVENSLIAYYVSKKELELSKIRTFLKTTLPDYMIPSFFVSIDSFPLTSNGKVDKKKLPKPDGSFSTGEQYIAPRNIIEEDLVEIWMDLLGIMQIGVNDNFFELGGSSLSILKLKKIISEKYGKVDIVDLFRNKTIKSLAKLLDRSLENKDIILDSSISLLDEYFIDERTEVEVGLVELDLEIEKSTLSKVFIISDQLKIDIEDVILSLFIYVLNEISNGDILKIQLMLDKERNKVKSNQFSLDDINSMEDLLINTNKSRKDFSKAFIYDLNHIQNIQIKNENNHILPLVYKRENYTLNYSLLEIYDLILEISNKSNRNYLLTFIANKNKLKPNKIKLLVNRFADILNQLTNEKIITEITV
ncbi:MAG: amino acid adenylation domain-containing protein, partial [bacterium]|nr:amino acid adenylation domain-containing protein [bacterium]